MKLLHPYMPFLTEEIFSHLIHDDESIMISDWPIFNNNFDYPNDVKKTEVLMDAIRKIRNVRVNMNVVPSRKAAILVVAEDETIGEMFISGKAFLERLASVSDVKILNSRESIPDTAVASVFNGGEIFIPLEDLIDIDKEIARLESESNNFEVEINRVEEKLGNHDFISKAPEKVVNGEKEKKEKYISMKKLVDERLIMLKQKFLK